MNLKWYDRASEDLQIAIKLTPTDASLYSMRSIIDGVQGDYSKSLTDLDLAIKYRALDTESNEDLPTIEELRVMRTETKTMLNNMKVGSPKDGLSTVP
jgi:hypothetical protein